MPCKIKLYRAFDFISLFCGERGIRTPGTLIGYDSLANCWFQPLTHLSKVLNYSCGHKSSVLNRTCKLLPHFFIHKTGVLAFYLRHSGSLQIFWSNCR